MVYFKINGLFLKSRMRSCKVTILTANSNGGECQWAAGRGGERRVMGVSGTAALPYHQAILRHHLGVIQFNLILTLCTWRQHQIPQVMGAVLQEYPTLQMPISSTGGHLGFWPMGGSVVSVSPLVRFNYFARAAHRTRRNILLTWSLVIMKRCNSGTARWKRYIGRGMEKGLRASMPSGCATLPESPCVHQPGSSPNALFSGFFGGFITWA